MLFDQLLFKKTARLTFVSSFDTPDIPKNRMWNTVHHFEIIFAAPRALFTASRKFGFNSSDAFFQGFYFGWRINDPFPRWKFFQQT